MDIWERITEALSRQRVSPMARRHGYELRKYKGVADVDGPYFLVDADREVIIVDRISLERAHD